MSWVSLCRLDELEEGQGRYVEVDGFKLAVFLNAGEVSVMDNTCPHAGASLASGFVEQGCVVCPLHLWAFNLRTGELPDHRGWRLICIKSDCSRVRDYLLCRFSCRRFEI